MAMVEASTLLDAAAGLLPELVEVRRAIHRKPELGLHLPETQQTVLDAIDGFGLDVSLGEGTTSITADLGNEGPTVLLRADMDALPMTEDTGLAFASQNPGAAHACGHDAHTAMLIGAARLLHDMRADLPGRVRFMFQPGEEGHHGAKVMIDEGVLEGVDAAFAIHVTPNMPLGFVAGKEGAMLASADELRITVRGKGGHASTPHFANDPIPVACEMVGAIQTFVTRRVDAFQPAIVTISAIHSGTTTNVIPEHAEIMGTVRTTSERTRDFVHRGIERVLDGVASAHEMEVELDIRRGYPVTMNHGDFSEQVSEVAIGLVGEDRYVEMPTPTMGAEDFSYVLQEVPGALVFLGVCPPDTNPGHAPSCHSNRMVLNEDAMSTGAALHAAVALDTLERLS